MNRLLICASCLTVFISLSACGLHKQSPTSESTNQTAQATKESPSKPEAPPPAPPTNDGELQPGRASGTFTVKGQVVELKYAYAGHAERFGKDSLVVLLTEKPIPAEAVAEEIKSATMLGDEKIRGLEYMIDEGSMWVCFHPGQYQESSRNKLKDYKVENGIVRGFDDNDGRSLKEGYARSVKFVAAVAK